MTNQNNSVLYFGVTGNLYGRVLQHKEGKGGKITSKSHVCKLLCFVCHDGVYLAFDFDKAIKGGSRQRKVDLVDEINPEWQDSFYKFQF